MDFRIIKSPSKGTLDILRRRKSSGVAKDFEKTDAIGLVQGKLRCGSWIWRPRGAGQGGVGFCKKQQEIQRQARLS